ncbi:hemin ABC transporter substrate-binding protein [Oceanisphaera marina]|uniref:Hemin ABC transporter substrate-binding protein n=1 Tax=Oceanisphaera marina TaxID=2017550 RepID=A0ABQ1ID50_9GAMM|nr:ABC transporter substrate-binding protein [Oceanisphaera marina]GGB32464.1 hemin ABC transporter substrate-binding protein [Oceanisphaera marina]
MAARWLLPLTLLLTTVVQAAPQRVLSAGNSMTELVFALHADDQLVAVDSTSTLPENSSLARLGYHRQLSAEGMLSTQPTLVIGSEEMGPPAALKLVRQAGVQVEALPEAMSVAQLQANILRLGTLLDREARAEALQQQVGARAQQLATHNTGGGKKTMFLLLGDGNTVQIAGSNTLANSLIRLAGGTNPAAASIDGYKPVAMEALVAMAPDVILISRRHLVEETGTASLLKQFPLLRQTPAADANAIVPINGKALIGGLGLSTLAEAERLHQHWLARP